MAELRIAPDLALPLELVVQQSAILARTGAGKTNTATVLVEEVLDAGQQVVVLDPPGAWWGLRSSADGTSAGYPIVVLGGAHGDLPLDPDGGVVVADFVVDTRASVVLDLSEMSGGQITRFVTSFAERLYARKSKSRDPMLLVIEEADELAPQSPQRDETRMLGAMERLAKRGRMRGIGTLSITQRSASLNKNVLSQIGVLIAMQTTAPQDIKAIDDWVQRTGDQERRAQLLKEIATLGVGEAFVWSPAWLRLFVKVKIRRRKTFDSSATPKPGEVRAAPKRLAEVDLAQLRERMAATVEKAKADDPKLLRAEIARLKAELAKASVIKPPDITPRVETVVERVEVEVPIVALDGDLDRLEALAEQLTGPVGGLTEALWALQERIDGARKSVTADRASHYVDRTTKPRAVVAVPRPTAPPPEDRAEQRPTARPDSDARITGPQQRILDALASFAALGVHDVARGNVAVFADASATSSAFANNLGALRTAGYVDYPAGGRVCLTEAGRALASASTPIGSVSELHAAWCAKLSGPQGRILRALVAAYPDPVDRERLAELAEASATSSAYANNLGALRSLGLVDYPSRGTVVATNLLFPDGVPA